MSRTQFIVPAPVTPTVSTTIRTPLAVVGTTQTSTRRRTKRIFEAASPGDTVLDTPTAAARAAHPIRESRAVESIEEVVDDNKQHRDVAVIVGSSSEDESNDSAEFGEDYEDNNILLPPSERLVLAVERVSRILESVHPESAKRRRRDNQKTPLCAYVDELWNAANQLADVEPKLDRHELEALWRVANYLHPQAAGERAIPLTTSFVTKEYRLISRPGDSCAACGNVSSSSSDCLCAKCMRIVALVRSVLTALLVRKSAGASTGRPIIAAIADLEKIRGGIRVNRTL